MKKKRDNNLWLLYDVYGIILTALAVLCFIGLFTNSGGTVGDFMNRTLKGLLGIGAYMIPFIFASLGISIIIIKDNISLTQKILGVIVIYIGIIVSFHISLEKNLLHLRYLESIKRSIDLGIDGKGGGLIGSIITRLILIFFGDLGTKVILAALGLIGIILLFNKSVTFLLKNLFSPFKLLLHGINQTSCGTPTLNSEEREREEEEEGETKLKNNFKIRIVNENNSEVQDVKNVNGDNTSVVSKEERDKENFEIIPIDNGIKKEYTLPPISLLKKNSKKRRTNNEKEIVKNAKLLETTLESFGIKAKVLQVSCGPAITRYEIQPAPGVKVSRIVTLADDIALSLAAADVRIEAPIPGKAAVGIEVPNKNISFVYLGDVIETKEFEKSDSRLTVALGRDIAGQPIVADLSNMPHLLVAGATGSGKSVCINTIICSILFKARPDEVKFLLIDPKVVELKAFDDIPHLITPVVTEPKKAASALNWVVNKMEERYKIFAQKGVRDITRYNEKVMELGEDDYMPKIVVIIDELADLMMVAPNDVEDAICRIAQMARAAGIHLVVATQRPSVDVITGVIKANIPSRIAFAVSSQTDSRTILDMGGAEKLLGRGDMLFYPVGSPKPKRVQGCYVSEEEVENLVNFIKSQGIQVHREDLPTENITKSKREENADELLYDALKIIVEQGQASVSLLQRKLHIGYTRASRIIDQLEERGFIGGYEGTKPRSVLITHEQLERIYNNEKTV
jgi:S-DNA-T family DNA segregation ATPase FtsK/SpoIIIE